MKTNFFRLLLVTMLPLNYSFAQILEYNHPPIILGQHEISSSNGDFLKISTDKLIINDLDGLDNKKFYVNVKPGNGYRTVSDNTVIIESENNKICLPITVSDGFSTSNEYHLTVNCNNVEKLDECTQIFISPEGNDRGKGSLENPLRTIVGARNMVRKLRQGGKLSDNGVVIWLKGGEYYLDDTVYFDNEDSGSLEAPVRIYAYKGEMVRLLGSKKIKYKWFEDTSDKITNLIIDKDARDKIKMLDLKKHRLTQYGELGHVGYVVRNQPLPPAMVYIDKESMHLSRYPNTENFNDIKNPVGLKQFTSASGRVKLWNSVEDIWIDGAVSKPWEWRKNKISCIDEKGTVTMVWDFHSNITTDKSRLFYYNIIEELDYPGEFYIDRKKDKLYIYLPQGTDEESDIRITQSDKTLIKLNNVKHLIFKGICFEGTRNSAIILDNNTEYVEIKDCEIHSCGLNGISVNGNNNVIRNCSIHHIGANGVVLAGGNVQTLQAAGNVIEGCRIYDFSQERRAYNPGVTLRGVGQVVRNTEIFNGPHMGMNITGNNHLVEFCDFHDCPKEYSDMLAIYMNTGGSPLMRGTVIRGNSFHDVHGSWKQSAGVYLDNETSGVLVEGNHFYNNGAEDAGWSVMIHGGADNVIQGNVFENCNYPFNISLRLNGYASSDFESLLKRWETILKTAPDVYYNFYPELNHYFDNEGQTPVIKDFIYHIKRDEKGKIINYWDRRTPSTNVFRNNVIYNSPEVPFCMPETNEKLNIVNHGYYTTGAFRIKDGVRIENLISYGNKVLNNKK